MPKKSADPRATPRTLLSIAQGSLILDNLDIVLKATDDFPATLFDLGEADFFSAGIARSRLSAKRSKRSPCSAPEPVWQTMQAKNARRKPWLKRCYPSAEAPKFRWLNLTQASTNLLVEESLIVGQQQPLIQMRCGDDDAARSVLHPLPTLVASQLLLQLVQAPEEEASEAPRIQGRKSSTSILSRDDAARAPQGDMVHLIDEVGLSNVSWRATNGIYAGWKRLLVSSLEESRQQRSRSLAAAVGLQGETRIARLADPWPSGPPSALGDATREHILAHAGPVAFEGSGRHRARSAPSSVGCRASPDAWVERVYEAKPAPRHAPVAFALPVIDDINDGLYHGERLDLNKVDLGKHLQDKLQRVTLRRAWSCISTGTGVCQTSSLRIKGVEHLVLFFVPTKDPSRALTLELHPAAIAQRSPIIEMTMEGHLELIGARVLLSPITLVPHVLSLQDASLAATRLPARRPARQIGRLVQVADLDRQPRRSADDAAHARQRPDCQ